MLKHYAARLWATVLIGGPAILLLLPVVVSDVAPAYTLAPAGAILLAVFFASGALLNRAGMRSVEGHLRSAKDWDRAGSGIEAEAAYRKAVAAFGSFLLSPRTRHRIFPQLTDHLAGFYKARSDPSTVSDSFIASYLRLHPEDEEIGEIWLRQVGNRGWLERDDQELAALIGNAQPESASIQTMLSRYYLMEERTDFSALETYRRMLAATGKEAPEDLVSHLADLFLEQGRADEWALPVYVRAFQMAPSRSELAAGIVACQKWLIQNEKNRKWIAAGRRLLEGVDPQAIRQTIGRFRVPDLQTEKAPVSGKKPKIRARLRKMTRFAVGAVRFLSDAVSSARRLLRDGFRWMKQSPAARRTLKWGAFFAAAFAAIFLVVNTAGYLIRSEKGPASRVPIVRNTGRFTIQVAAYLKEEHARRYADELKSNGLDVYWTEKTGERKTWYQVRISRFEDKASARAFGDELKAKGIVEDFYIANYESPAR